MNDHGEATNEVTNHDGNLSPPHYLLELLKNVQSAQLFMKTVPSTCNVVVNQLSIQVIHNSRVLLNIPLHGFHVISLGEQFSKRSHSSQGVIDLEMKLGLVISSEQRQSALENEHIEDIDTFITMDHIQQLCCRACNFNLFNSSTFPLKRVISTPSENWLEMTDMWVCTCCSSGSHSHNHTHKHHKVASNTSAFGMYSQSSDLGQQPTSAGVCLAAPNFLILHSLDVEQSNVQIEAFLTSPPTSNCIDLTTQVFSKNNATSASAFATCKSCRTVLGFVESTSFGEAIVKLLKHKIKSQTEVDPFRFFGVETYVASVIADVCEEKRQFKFVIQSQSQTILIQLLNADSWIQSNVSPVLEKLKPAQKVLYLDATSVIEETTARLDCINATNGVREVLKWQQTPHQVIRITESECQQLLETLRVYNGLFSAPRRMFGNLYVSLLRRVKNLLE